MCLMQIGSRLCCCTLDGSFVARMNVPMKTLEVSEGNRCERGSQTDVLDGCFDFGVRNLSASNIDFL
jgi:hypothetical protein